jgi:hypothetical protein
MQLSVAQMKLPPFLAGYLAEDGMPSGHFLNLQAAQGELVKPSVASRLQP